MKLIKKAELLKPHGSKVMRFEIAYCEVGNDRYVVNFRQGLTGMSMYEGSVTLTPVARPAADRAFDHLIHQKQREGYELVDDSGAKAPAGEARPAAQPAPAKAATGATAAAKPAGAGAMADKDSHDAVLQRRRGRRAKRVLDGLRWPAESTGQLSGDQEALGCLVKMAGDIPLPEAEPLLLKLAPRAQPRLAVVIARALGRCGSAASVSTLGAMFSDFKGPEMVRRAAAEALMALSSEPHREEMRASLRATLPRPLAALSPAGDPEAFQLALAEVLAHGTDEHHAVIDTLYLIGDPVSRPSLLSYARTAPFAPPSFRRLRHLFKGAEFRRDGELFGILARRFEVEEHQITTSRWHRQPSSEAKEGKKAFSDITKSYLRRRVWRTLRRLGDLGDASFVPMAVGTLVVYSDADGDPERQHQQYDYTQRKTITTAYGPHAAHHALNKLLYRNSKRAREGNRLFFRWLQAPPDPKRLPGEEAYPELWRARPEGLLHLLDESACAEVHAFAALALGGCKEFCENLDFDVLRMLLGRPYEPTARLGFELAQRRYDPRNPDVELLGLMATSAYAPARQRGADLLWELREQLRERTALLASLAAAPYADARQRAGELLAALKLADRPARALVARVLAAMLAMGPGDEARAAETRRLLVAHLGPHLGSVGEAVIRDLLAHPLAEVQIAGGEALILAPGSPPDELLWMLLNGSSEGVRSAGARLLARLPDAELLERPLLLARLMAHPAADQRAATRQLARRLVRARPSFGPELAGLLIDALLRRKLPEGAPADLVRALREDFTEALAALPPSVVLRILRSDSPHAQELGGQLLQQRDLAAEFSVDDLAKLASHDIVAIRQAARAMLDRSVERVRADMAGALRVLDSPWEDTRAWAFDYFRERFGSADWTLDLLVSVADSVRPDVEAFGRELMSRHFRDDEGPELMLRLSEHPSLAAQLQVTNYLERYAAGSADRIRGLKLYFASVLERVNKGRVAKHRVLDFLRRQAVADEEIAHEVLPILHRMTATAAVQYRALALEAIAEVARAHPSLPSPVPTIQPEARHGVQLRLQGQLRRRQPQRPHRHGVRARRQAPAHLFFGRAWPGRGLPRGHQRAARRGGERPALQAQGQDRLQGVGGAARGERPASAGGRPQAGRRAAHRAAKRAERPAIAPAQPHLGLREGQARLFRFSLQARLQRVDRARPGDHGAPRRDRLRVLQPG